MEKKAKSGPMMEILNRMLRFVSGGHAEFSTVFFPEEIILNAPVEEWPLCDVLFSWFSSGFPLHKAQAYAALRKPFVLNDLHQQEELFDRRIVYRKLEEMGVPVPAFLAGKYVSSCRGFGWMCEEVEGQLVAKQV